MKRLFTLLFICLTTIALQAQSTKELDGYPTIFSDYGSYYDKWISENEYFKTSSWLKKGWSIYYRFADNTYQKAYMYIPVGDSIVAGKAYARVLINQKTLLYRQENDKVFIRTDGEDKLLIDYGLKEGDTFVSPQGEHFMVIATDTATYQGSSYGSYKYWRYQCIFFLGNTVPRILHLQSEDGTKEDEWVEGLGSAYWGILPPYLAECQDVYPKRPVKSHVITASSPCLIEEGEYISASYNLNEEDYKRISFEPQDIEYWEDHPWTFTFIGDTLHITGAMDLNCLPTYAECTIKGNDIDVLIYQVSNGLLEPDCMVERYVDIRFTGFKPGTYKIGISGEKRQEVVCTGKQEESYIPFVEKWKKWHVLGFNEGPAIPYDYEFGQSESVIDGKTYYPLYLKTGEGTNWEKSLRFYLFREENRRVYLYDYETAQEHCVYDFTLEVGDTFDIGWGDEADRCVVTKVDYIDVKGSKLKTITFSSVNPADGCEPEHKDHTWVEGIGDLSQPIAGWKPNSYERSWSYHLAYMLTIDDLDNYYVSYYPFSFSGMSGNNDWVLGKELIPGKRGNQQCVLEYEITRGRLHVTGYMWLNHCDNRYIYCKISPTEDNKTFAITLEDESIIPIATGAGAYAVDLYFDLPPAILNNNYNFVAVDEEGVEHPVPNRDKYQPFVAEGKVWKVGLFWNGSNQASEVEFYCLEGDTIVGDRTCKKWMLQTMSHENRKAEYIGAVYEEDGRVYEFLPGRCEAVMLYDFATPVGEWVEVYDAYEDRMDSCYIAKRDTVSIDGYLLRQTTVWSYPNDETTVIYKTIWTEGIGYNKRPNYNTDSENPGDYHWLMACTTADDMLLYQSPTLYEDISEYWRYVDDLDKTDAEARKEKLDFTHVIKTRPTAPACYATGISLLWGEYDNTALTIGFGNMGGTYTIAVLNVDGEECFFQKQETANLQSLDISLANFATGDYTIAVENDDEAYTAHFALPFDGNGISEIKNEESISKNYYDLTGREVSVPSMLPKGVYLHNKRKVIIHE